jgi:hypothetical protein
MIPPPGFAPKRMLFISSGKMSITATLLIRQNIITSSLPHLFYTTNLYPNMLHLFNSIVLGRAIISSLKPNKKQSIAAIAFFFSD